MQLSNEEHDLIERYLEGKLQGQELQQFSFRLKTDAVFAEEVALQKAANNLLLENGLYELRSKLDNYTAPGSYSIKTILLVVFLTLCVGIGGYWMFKDKENKKQEEVQHITNHMTEDIAEVDDSSNSKQLSIKQNKERSSGLNQNQMVGEQKESLRSNKLVDSVISYPKENSVDVKMQDTIGSSLPAKTKITTIHANPCDKVEIVFDAQSYASCDNLSNGRIEFNTIQVKGGKGPYKYSINGGRSFQDVDMFSSLQSGYYDAVILDKNECLSKEKRVFVPSKSCIKENAFVINPDAGEVWQLPEGYSNCNLYIYDQSGDIVYQNLLKSAQDNEWNGVSNQGKALGMGQYLYTITCQGELKEKGFITIVR